MKKKIAIFCPYPFNQAPSQRFRYEQYLALLQEKNFKITLLPLLNQSAWEVLHKRNFVFKAVVIVLAVMQRFYKIGESIRADFILIHREILPIGPPIIEWLLTRVFRKKVIYDFDDAIWITDKIKESWLEKKLRWRSKVSSICRWSYKVSCGNDYLCGYARQFNKNVVLNPTTIETEKLHNRILYYKSPYTHSAHRKITIGWTGSHSTLKYLESLESVLQQIEAQYPMVSILVIADKPPALHLKKLVSLPWTKETEIEDLCQIDIGIMPLPDDEWTKGKCGFKALQYMALGIPTLVSPVAVNKSIVKPGVNGYWCTTEPEWIDCLARLIEDAQLRKELGENGRKTVLRYYSFLSNKENFLSLFQ